MQTDPDTFQSRLPNRTDTDVSPGRIASNSASDTAAGTTDPNQRGPFILKFKTKDNCYVYDVNLNAVVKVGNVEYEIVDDYGVLTFQELLDRHKDGHSPTQLRAAYKAIDDAHTKHGYFSNKRPSRLMYKHDQTSLTQLYDERLSDLILGVTEQCNLRCAYCVYSGTHPENRQHNSKSMSFETARKALEFFRNHSRLVDKVIIGFYGGEPLLNIRLVKECVEYANHLFDRKLVTYNMTTNGTSLSADICDFLVSNDFKLLVSLDGPPNLHDRYRRFVSGAGTFDTIMRNLTYLEGLSPIWYRQNVGFNMLLAPQYDYDGFAAFVSGSPLIKDNRLRVSFVSAYDTNFYERFIPDEQDTAVFDRKKAEFWDLLIAANGHNYWTVGQYKLERSLFVPELERVVEHMTATTPFGDIYHPGGICLPGLKKLFVSTDGKLIICERVNSEKDLFCLGTVDTGLDAEKAMDTINKFLSVHNQCLSCPALRHCTVCFVGADLSEAFSAGKKARRCNDYVGQFKTMLVDMMTILERSAQALNYIVSGRVHANEFADTPQN
ncbi:MAG: radical SAM protein [Limisphaerales bacterium]